MTNGFNQYLCDFCKSPCIKGKLAITHNKNYGKNVRWHHCKNCLVSYIISSRGKKKLIKFEIKGINSSNIYTLNIDYLHKTTIITCAQKELLSLDYCLNNITPLNFQDKLKLYLLFS